MSDMRAKGYQVFREMLPGLLPDEDDRSLVTLGILIALRATDEIRSHVQIAVPTG